MSLQCPECGAEPGRVTDSRNRVGSRGWYRRRRCEKCDAAYTTLECVATVDSDRHGAWVPREHDDPRLEAAVRDAIATLTDAIQEPSE